MILLTILGALCFALTALKVMFDAVDYISSNGCYAVAEIGVIKVNHKSNLRNKLNMKKVKGFRA